MDRKKQAFLGLAILVVLIIIIVVATTLNNKDTLVDSNLKQVFVATGGRKRKLLSRRRSK